MSAPREDRPAMALSLGLAAFFCFALVDTSAKFLALASFPVFMTVFARYAVNFFLVIAFFVPRYGRTALISNAPLLQVMRGLTLLASTWLNFLALQYLPLTTTIPIFFAAPLIVCLLSVPILGEPVGLRRYFAVGVGLVGVLMIVRPTGVVFHWAMLVSLGATLGAALYFILTRMVAGRDDMPVSQVWASGIATVIILPFAISNFELPREPLHWLPFLAAGTFATIGHGFLTIAYRFAAASKLAPLLYTEIIYIAAISWVLFSEVPDTWTVVGTVVIVASGLYVWLRERAVNARERRNIASRSLSG